MNKIEQYTPTSEEWQLAKKIMTSEQLEMSERRANESKETPDFIEAGQIWSVTYPDGKDFGDILIWSVPDSEGDEFEKENPMVQGYLVDNKIDNATEGSLILIKEESPLEKECAIHTLFNGRFLVKQLKEYKGDIGENNKKKLFYLFFKDLGLKDLEKDFDGDIKTGEVIISESDPRINLLKTELEKLNCASSEFDKQYHEYMDFQEKQYNFIEQIKKDLKSENVGNSIEDYTETANMFGFEIPKKLLNQIKRKVIVKNIKDGDYHVAKNLLQIEKMPLKAIEKDLFEILVDQFGVNREKAYEMIDELEIPRLLVKKAVEKFIAKINNYSDGDGEEIDNDNYIIGEITSRLKLDNKPENTLEKSK